MHVHTSKKKIHLSTIKQWCTTLLLLRIIVLLLLLLLGIELSLREHLPTLILICVSKGLRMDHIYPSKGLLRLKYLQNPLDSGLHVVREHVYNVLNVLRVLNVG